MDSQDRLGGTSINDAMADPLQPENDDNDDEYWADHRSNIIERALVPHEDRRSVEEACQTIFSFVASISSGRRGYPNVWDDNLMAKALDNLWFHVCWEGMTRDLAFEQQQLVHLVGAAKNSGSLGNYSGWAELPGLKAAMMGMLQGLSYGFYNESPDPAVHWRNLQALAARLSACGVCDLRSCGLEALRYALEDEEDSRIPMLHRLEAVQIWLNSQGFWIESLVCCERIAGRAYGLDREGTLISWEPQTPDSVPPGQLAAGAGIVGEGISWERWQFWRSRLETMLADVDGDGRPSKISTKAYTLLQYLTVE